MTARKALFLGSMLALLVPVVMAADAAADSSLGTWKLNVAKSTLGSGTVPKAETRVVLFTAEGEEKRIGTMMNMSYACDEIEKTYEELKARGVEFEGPPQKQPWGSYAMFTDSEGNRFVLSS